MKDQIVEAPDRFAIEWLDKDTGLCRIIKKPGAVAQPGSLYCVENVLPGDVCANLGLDQNTAEPKDAFKALTALAASALVGFPSDLENLQIETFSITNAAAGWCTHYFRSGFLYTPRVMLSPVNFEGYVQVNNITNGSFQYQLRKIIPGDRTTIDTTTEKVVMLGLAVGIWGEQIK